MNLTEQVLSAIDKNRIKRLERAIDLADKFASIRLRETIWSEDRLLKSVRTAKVINSESGYLIAQE